ncbi:uncharacterized protein [Henckelia pumila]|uniref:uncharacterized protein n=1 Tax=Henckelia pumila TaxID=405737 RepID=UPI003C6E0816
MAANANLSLRQLGTPDLNLQPLCVTFPSLEANATFELKSSIIHLLPSFHGLAGEDPHKHLMEFHVVCISMKPQGVTEEQIQLSAFSFSLKNAAKDLLYYLPPGSITTWTEMKRIILENYFPALRAANIIKEIHRIMQHMGESLHEYWERSMVDAASVGVFVDKIPRDARNLIKNMAANSQQFVTNRIDPAPRRNNKVNVSSLEPQLIGLTSLVHQLAVGNGQNVKKCGICDAMGHSTEMCPTLQGETVEQVNATGGFPGPPQRNYDPYLNTYNPGWIDHPHLRYGNTLQETRASIQNLNTQVGQLETAIKKLEAQHSKILPSQTVPNPKENVSAITLRSQKELKVREKIVQAPVKNEDDKESKVEEDEIIQKDTPKGHACKIESKIPPDLAKGIPMGNGRNHPEMGISKKSKERKHGPKLTVQILKWVKVDKGTRYERLV